MRTRTFIGLILLVIILVVVSTPMLLNPTADGIDKGLVAAGLASPSSDTSAISKKKKKIAKQKLKGSLSLRGHDAVNKYTNLRDEYDTTDVPSTATGRLSAGATRLLMPGELDRSGDNALPYLSTKTVLLDKTGCPKFRPETNVTTLLADKKVKKRYDDLVAKADDPKACKTTYAQRVKDATTMPATDATSAFGLRLYDQAQRQGMLASYVATNEFLMWRLLNDDINATYQALYPSSTSSSTGATSSTTGGSTPTTTSSTSSGTSK